MRYVARPRPVRAAPPKANYVSWEDEVTLVPDVTVYEEEPCEEFVGLFNADGDPLYRTEDKEPLGFYIPGQENSDDDCEDNEGEP